MKKICIIPTKDSSTRFKNKNIAKFGPDNLITRTIRQAINSHVFDQIILTSNNEDMLDMGRKYRIDSHFMEDTEKQIIGVVRNTINQLKIKRNSTIGVLLVTCPLRIPEDIVGAHDLFVHNKRKHPVVSVKKNENPVQMAFKKDVVGQLEPIMPDDFYRSTRKQDHYDTFYFNDAIIFDTAKKFIDPKRRTLYGEFPLPYLMPWERSIAIDYEFQLDMAKGLLRGK